MRKILTVVLLTVIAALCTQAGIKERLAARLPAINRLKEALLIGENNKGFLEIKGNISADDKKIVEAENADRKKIYDMLAKKAGVAVDVIQTRRAEVIAKKSKKGIWLQKPDGTWYKK